MLCKIQQYKNKNKKLINNVANTMVEIKHLKARLNELEIRVKNEKIDLDSTTLQMSDLLNQKHCF